MIGQLGILVPKAFSALMKNRIFFVKAEEALGTRMVIWGQIFKSVTIWRNFRETFLREMFYPEVVLWNKMRSTRIHFLVYEDVKKRLNNRKGWFISAQTQAFPSCFVR
jgi:hypothetical protein